MKRRTVEHGRPEAGRTARPVSRDTLNIFDMRVQGFVTTRRPEIFCSGSTASHTCTHGHGSSR